MTALGRLIVVTPSTDEPVSRTDVKEWLKLEEEETADDALIDSLIATARARYEQHAQKALMKQTFDLYYDAMPCGAIVVPRSPLVSVTSIKGFSDTDATDSGGTAMNSSEFYVDVTEPSRIVPFGGYTFPTATRIANAAIIRFVAGYSSETTGIPEQAKTTIKKMVARAYEFRGDHSQAEIDALMTEMVQDELSLPEWG